MRSRVRTREAPNSKQRGEREGDIDADQEDVDRNSFLVGCIFHSPLLYGQANGSFSGTVSDKTGSVISGATVTVTSQGTGLSRETKTDDTGHYLTPLLPVGNYTIRVNSQGFKIIEQTDIRLQVNE